MTKRKIAGAFCGSIVFSALLILLNWQIDPEKFEIGNYWFKPILQGIIMFFVFLLPTAIQNITWKEFYQNFSKFLKSSPSKNV